MKIWHRLFGHAPSSIGAPFCDCQYGPIQFAFLKGKGK